MKIYLYLGFVVAGLISWALASGFWAQEGKSRNLGIPGSLNRNPEKSFITYEQGIILLITSVISTADIFLPAIIAFQF